MDDQIVMAALVAARNVTAERLDYPGIYWRIENSAVARLELARTNAEIARRIPQGPHFKVLPKYTVEGQVYFAGGFNITLHAENEAAAEREAKHIAGEMTPDELGAELQEICINGVQIEPPPTHFCASCISADDCEARGICQRDQTPLREEDA